MPGAIDTSKNIDRETSFKRASILGHINRKIRHFILLLSEMKHSRSIKRPQIGAGSSGSSESKEPISAVASAASVEKTVLYVS